MSRLPEWVKSAEGPNVRCQGKPGEFSLCTKDAIREKCATREIRERVRDVKKHLGLNKKIAA